MSAIENEFGFTNDHEKVVAARAFMDAAASDGWSIKPTYSEPVECAASLERDGFSMLIIARENGGEKFKYQAQVNIWGPDRLAIAAPKEYSWAKILGALSHCNVCDKDGVEIHRYSFAGRCCADCLPAMRAKHERPGWCN